MKYSMLAFLRTQLFRKMPDLVTADLSGQTIVVVGANTGIGYDATKHFATMKGPPARIIMACRSKQRGEAAVQQLASETGYKAELWLVDLADFSSVTAFADRFDRDGGRLDILVMNAGLMTPDYQKSVDGWESCLQVNNLATPLLSLRMLPHLARTGKEFQTVPRLVTVASDVHYWALTGKDLVNAPDLLTKLSDPKYCTPKRLGEPRYHLCKLLNVLFTRALQERLSSASCPVVSVCLTPSLCRTNLMGNMKAEHGKLFVGIVDAVMKVLAYTSEEGSRQVVYAAIGGREEMRGAFVMFSEVTEPSDFVISKDGYKMQNQYWSELVMVLSKVDIKVASIVDELLKSS